MAVVTLAPIRTALLFTWLLLGFACSSTKSGESLAPKADEHSILQFAPVAKPDDVKAREYEIAGRKVRLAAPCAYQFQYIEPTTDSTGHPALHFEVVEDQKDVFESWTASLVGRDLAVIVDGEVVTVARVLSALEGEGIIEFGLKRKSKEEMKALANRIRSQSVKKDGD
jgi:preprotein translocase subunit SecD